ncbi:MAG: TetR/AcrR family transcriptional regulator [Candidatus Protistobacter heckmanni]|nr:TetR/AcrR family transcriptional regulator [Candidatus Protistobacter heckmanni]
MKTDISPIDSASEDPCAKPRWERRKGARPQELVAAAVCIFVEKGYAATRLEDVAAAAGVSKGTVYLYFANKQELFEAVVRENIVPIIDEAEEKIQHHTGPAVELLQMFIGGWAEKLDSSHLSGISKLMMAEASNFPDIAAFYHQEVISRCRHLLWQMLERGVASGEFRPLNIEKTAQLLVAQMMFLMMWKHSFGVCVQQPIDPVEYVGTMLENTLSGILKR